MARATDSGVALGMSKPRVMSVSVGPVRTAWTRIPRPAGSALRESPRAARDLTRHRILAAGRTTRTIPRPGRLRRSACRSGRGESGRTMSEALRHLGIAEHRAGPHQPRPGGRSGDRTSRVGRSPRELFAGFLTVYKKIGQQTRLQAQHVDLTTARDAEHTPTFGLEEAEPRSATSCPSAQNRSSTARSCSSPRRTRSSTTRLTGRSEITRTGWLICRTPRLRCTR